MEQYLIYDDEKNYFDTVFYNNKADIEDVKQGLINHDGYDSNISIIHVLGNNTRVIHILEYYHIDRLISQIDYMINPKESLYKCARRIVEGGCLLITYGDIEKAFNETWEQYVHNTAIIIELLYNHYSNELLELA